MRKGVHLSILLVLVMVSFAMAQIPQTMSYQGVLTGADGNPVADGAVSLTFKLYDVAADGAALWEEAQNIEVRNGIFNAILGSVTTLNLPFDKQYWLGIAVGQDAEMTPRIALTASPYSLGATATVTEPAAGQSFVVRNAAGAATHQLSAAGNVLHKGVGTFEGGVKIPASPDTSLIISDNNGFIFLGPDTSAQQIAGKDRKGVNELNAVITRTHLGVRAISTPRLTANRVFSQSFSNISFAVVGKGILGGVAGDSKSGSAVFGTSDDGIGGQFISQANIAVEGTSPNVTGVQGNSNSGVGVEGISTSGIGVGGLSETNTGVFAVSTSEYGLLARGGMAAGKFEGDVLIEQQGKLKIDNVPAENSDQFLVWGADKFVKMRSLPATGSGFDGTLVGQPFYLVNATGDTVFSVGTDGTSLHKGDETFEGDVILKGTNGKGIKLVDATGTTLAGFGRVDLDTGQNIGVFAKAQNPGDLAAVFEGPVDVLGEITASSLHIVNTNGDSLTDFFADGTSRHRGLETYEAGIAIVNSDGSTAIDLQPNTDPSTGYALTINGNIMVNGLLQATAKDFRIDHPLDPENKYLTHTSVESPDMKTVYDGVVLLNDHGESGVELPEWFQALNGDFRYQLTAIGAPAPDLYIAEEIQNNRFRIAGGTAGMKVSWQVTGIRHDAWAQEHRQTVEGYKGQH